MLRTIPLEGCAPLSAAASSGFPLVVLRHAWPFPHKCDQSWTRMEPFPTVIRLLFARSHLRAALPLHTRRLDLYSQNTPRPTGPPAFAGLHASLHRVPGEIAQPTKNVGSFLLSFFLFFYVFLIRALSGLRTFLIAVEML